MNCLVLYEYYYMYCIAMSKCGLWEHCVQAALYEAQPQAWHMLQGPHFMLLIGIICHSFIWPFHIFTSGLRC